MALARTLDTEDLIDRFADRGVEGEKPWNPGAAAGPFDEGFYFLGFGTPPLEVCVVPARQRPRRDEVRELWKSRQGRQASPLLLVCPFSAEATTDAHVCGPTDVDLTVRELGFDQAVGLAAGALAEPSGLAAVRFLHQQTPKEGQDFQGLVNQGMFAAHTLRGRVRELPEWPKASSQGETLRKVAGRELVQALGFTIETSNTPVHVLRAPSEQARAVAIFLDRNESPSSEGGRFGDTSALSQAFTRAERDNIPFVLFTRGPEIRLYAVSGYEGVGRKGQAETYVQANVGLLADDETGFLPLIFGAEALLHGGTFERILNWSRDFSAHLSARLRDRVYKDVVPALAVAVAEEHARDHRETERSLDGIYEETLVILFRLLFLAYAEDRDLLPYSANAEYRRNSLKAIGRALADRLNDGKNWDGIQTHALWSDVMGLFEAVDKGNSAWGVPAYNGGLFSPDRNVSQAGAAIDGLRLTDECMAPPLAALLTERGDDGVVGPIDFRSLSVRDFGTIYEGLLESNLSVATTDLAVDARENYVPAATHELVVVPEGDIYFHNRSGARKASGSYFTKDFAVEHLLEAALEPALGDHLDRLKSLLAAHRDDEAARAFFDFRCADLAMGSGHFLVAAVDHIERRLAQFLDEQSVPSVEAELDMLRAAAVGHLGDSAVGYEIERRQLLRRQVARRCVYGVDRNRLAVELARLSLWVHTFVPGLPLSFLDHNLVQGDSLTGIGTIGEAVEYLSAQAAGKRAKHGQSSIFETMIVEWLEKAKEPLLRLARASDATRAELREVRDAQAEARRRAEPVRRLFDLVSAVRRGEAEPLDFGLSTRAIDDHPQLATAEVASRDLGALHFPVAFPEVFLRDRPGFDVIIGNPPWEKLQVEEHSFWALRYPGLRGLPTAERERELTSLRERRPDIVAEFEQAVAAGRHIQEALLRGPYPELGRSDPDLFKAFSWRFWYLVRDDGFIGVVLPRLVLAGSGMALWRETILAEGEFSDVTLVVNNRGWVFDEVHQQYTIGLIAIRKGTMLQPVVRLRGPYSSRAAMAADRGKPAAIFDARDFQSWTTGAAFPLMPSAAANDVFLKLRLQPSLAEDRGWRARPVRELDATDDKGRMVMEPVTTTGLWPVWKGATYNLWAPDTGPYYAWADPEQVTDFLHAKRQRQQRRGRSAFSEFSSEWAADKSTLPCLSARISFRDVARATDTRTVIATLVPPNVFLNHTARYVLWPRGDERDQAYLLGVLCSIPLDWYARRFVEAHVTFELLNRFPIPRPERDSQPRRRVEEIAGRLAATDSRYEAWAAAVGVPVGSVAGEDKLELIAELDALVAKLYELDRTSLTFIFDTFHVGWDCRDRLDRTLAHFEAL